MAQVGERTVLITGANAGIGKDLARQLAVRGDADKIYLACRNEGKAATAKRDLESVTGRSIFEVVLMDVADIDSVRTALKSLDHPLDTVVMNAGGIGGKTPTSLTATGTTQVFASNVLGHVVLLESLLAEGRLTGTALYAGSEAARGVPKMGIKRPSFTTTSADELATVIDGSYFQHHKFDRMLAYGQVKYLAALWMGCLARHHPQLRLLTISPGNTAGTNAMNDMPFPLGAIAKHVVLPFVAPALGMGHKLETGAARIADGLTNPDLRSGAFYASAAHTVSGPLVDQADIFPDLRNTAYQDNANQAIHRFIA